MASAGMDRRRKFDFLDAAAATAAAAEAAPVRLGGELVDVGAAAQDRVRQPVFWKPQLDTQVVIILKVMAPNTVFIPLSKASKAISIFED